LLQFLCSEKDVGKTRAEASAASLQKIAPNAKIEVIANAIDENVLAQYNVRATAPFRA
jgi:molybdopterin/thiamine biosynthesis adenylyltransferase